MAWSVLFGSPMFVWGVLMIPNIVMGQGELGHYFWFCVGAATILFGFFGSLLSKRIHRDVLKSDFLD